MRDLKKPTCYFFNDMINIINFDANNTKIDENLYKNILIYYIGYLKITDSKYVKINLVNPLYLIFNNVNRFFEGIDGNKYLKVVPTNESKEKIKNYEELWIKIRDLIRSITKNLDDYDEKYMKINFNLDGELPLNKMIEITTRAIVVWDTFLKITNIIHNFS